MNGREPVEVFYDEEIEVKAKTLARLFRFGTMEIWIPKSQILLEDERRKLIEIPEWLAIEKGLA